MAKKTMTVEVQVPIPEVSENAHYEAIIADLKKKLSAARSKATRLDTELFSLKQVASMRKDICEAHDQLTSALDSLPISLIDGDW